MAIRESGPHAVCRCLETDQNENAARSHGTTQRLMKPYF